MHRTVLSFLAAWLAALGLAACGAAIPLPWWPTDPPEPAFDPALFDAQSASVTNPWFPLVPGTTLTYEGETEEGMETIVMEVTHDTRVILGVACVVVQDRAYVDGELVEETWDWYAQDVDGNVWYLGEDTTEYEDGVPVGTAGSWEAGVDGAVAGILFKADPKVGDSYQQEYYAGEAEDMAEVVALDVTVTLTDGTVHTGCAKTREWTPLEPDVEEFKYYAAGVGLVLESQTDGSEPVELVDVAP